MALGLLLFFIVGNLFLWIQNFSSMKNYLWSFLMPVRLVSLISQ